MNNAVKILFRASASLVFFFVFTPAALLFKLLRIDPMDLSFRKKRQSFFKPARPSVKTFKTKTFPSAQHIAPPDESVAPDTVYPLW